MSCSCSINGYGSMLNAYGPMLNGYEYPYRIGLAGHGLGEGNYHFFGSGLGSGNYHFQGSGLGQIDPVTLTAAISEAASLFSQIEAALGIDAGSHEANIIVPVQNAVVNSVIAPVSAFLNSVNTGTHVPTCQELQTWLSEVKAAYTQWENYLHNTHWVDGRAAQQAESTLASYWTNATNDLNKYIGQYCGIGATGGIFVNPVTGQFNLTTIALIGAAAYFLLKK